MVDEIKVPHGEQCDQALEHYLKISNEATHFSSLVPAAIEFYKERYVPQGERQIIISSRLLEDALKEGWTFDPWLNPSGRPTLLNDADYYWVLIKGTPEQIAGMDPIAELPELDEEPEVGADPYGLRTDFIPYAKEDGKPVREPAPGFVVMKGDHVYAKGTVYTLPPRPVSPWSLAIQLAGLSKHLGVDEAHDVIDGILKKERAEMSG